MAEWISKPVGQRQLSYWIHHLAHAHPMTLSSHREDRETDPQGTNEPLEIDSNLTHALRATVRDLRTTMFTILLAAQNVLMARLTGQTDITIGAVVSGRALPAIRSIVGYLADRIYYRTDLAGNPSFADVVMRVQDTILEATSRQFVGSDLLMQELERGGYALSAPIFNFGPRVIDDRSEDTNDVGSRIQMAPPPFITRPRGGMCYWLELRETANETSGRLRYTGPAVEGLSERFREILRQAVSDRQCRVLDFRLST
jgi:hypothetical protein